MNNEEQKKLREQIINDLKSGMKGGYKLANEFEKSSNDIINLIGLMLARQTIIQEKLLHLIILNEKE